MLIYISTNVQYSVFSGGSNMTSLQLALGFKELGHEVALLNILDNGMAWFDDCQDLRSEIPVVQKSSFMGLVPSGKKADLLIDVLGCISGPDRLAIADKNVLFMRHPTVINEIECCIYPATILKRFYDNINEVWTYDFYSKNDYVVLKMLAQCPIRVLPFFWSPKIVATFCQGSKISPWYWTQASSSEKTALKIRIAENNSNIRSNCTLPLVICRHFDKQYPDIIKEIKISNGQIIKDRAFFKDNIVRHIDTIATPIFEGRSRAVEWAIAGAGTVVLCHNRFTTTRLLHFDLAWMGIPIVHNSVFLKQLGGELDAFYYENNSVTGATAALKRCYDAIQEGNYFNETLLQRTRYVISNGLSIRREKVIDIWSDALSNIGSEVAPVYVSKPLPIKETKPQEKTDLNYAPTSVINESEVNSKIYRMQFIGMWDQFQPTYNFFTLLMQNYLIQSGSELKVVGCGSEYKGNDIQIRILGPFGCNDAIAAGIPTVFFTGENIDPLSETDCERNNINLQLGFNPNGGDEYMRVPLWMLYIDWFNADNDRLVNPKVISLDKCTKNHVRPASERKQFCAFIVSNPNNPKRNEAFTKIGQIGHVVSAGRHLNNYGDSLFAGLGGGGGELRKVSFLEDFRFNITYENGYGPGYVTEKLFHAKVAGAIPIYWGDSEWVAKDFNPLGFIDARGLTDEELLGRIRWLESAEGQVEMNRISQTPLFNENKASEIKTYLMTVAARIMQLSDIKPTQSVSSRENVAAATAPTAIYGRSY